MKRIALALLLTGLIAWSIGCKKEEVNHPDFVSAINKSFGHRHECVWPEPIKMPAEADPSKDERVRDFDVLSDAGLLTRESAAQRQRFGAKQLNKYSLSDKGHSAWTADPDQPGYGNFCFGHFNATAIEKAVPNDASNPTQYTVNYHYEVEGMPDWVSKPESMRAFPKLAADTRIQSATATLVKGTDGSWAVAPAGSAQ